MSVNITNTKIAVIGCGNWGKNHIRVYQALGALYAVYDAEPTKATSFCEAYHVPYMTLDEIIKDKSIDAVVIATPSITHFELAIKCLKAQKHVFIEKPFTLNVKDALALTQLAKERGCLVMVGHLLHYHAGFNKLKALAQDGTLGELQYIYSHRLSFGKFRSEENVLWDFAPHDVSMILGLTKSMPIEILATGSNYFQHSVVDTSHLHLSFNKKVQAHIFVSWYHPYKEQRMIVVGSKAMAVFDDLQPWEKKLTLYHYPEQWHDGLPQPFPSQSSPVQLEPSEPLLNECQHFINCIVNKTIATTSAEEGLKVISVLEAATKSIATQQKVTIQRRESEVALED